MLTYYKMKKVIVTLFVISSFCIFATAQTNVTNPRNIGWTQYRNTTGRSEGIEDKVEFIAPIFYVTKVEILCCQANRWSTIGQKTVHIVSSAGTSVFTSISLKITDANNVQVALFNHITSDFTTPCLNLIAGQLYTISVLDGFGNIILMQNGEQNPFSRLALDCMVRYNQSLGPTLHAGLGLSLVNPVITIPDLGNLVPHPIRGFYLGFEILSPINMPKQGPLFSVLANASYSRFSLNAALELVNTKYPVEGQHSSTKRFGKTPGQGSVFAAGLATKITQDIKRFSVSLSAMAGYQSLSLPGMSVQDDSVKNNGTNLIYLRTAAYKKGGIFILPQFELGYWFSSHIGFTAGFGYNMGPKIELNAQTLAASDFNKDGVYSKTELAKGSLNTTNVTVTSNYIRLSAGLTISLF